MMTLRGRIAHAATPLWQQTAACILMGGAAGVAAGGCSNASTPTAPGTQQSLVAQEAPSQPAGTIFSVEIVDGKALNYTTRDLPASASKSSAAFMQEPKPPPPPPRPVKKISPALQKDVGAAQANGTADQSIAVIVTFKDQVKVPRFPEPNMAEPRDSPANKAAVQRVISSLERVRAPTYDARAKELAAKHAAKEKARFWLIDAMVLELPLSAVSDVAARGDVQYVEHVKSDAPPPQNYTISNGSSLIGTNFYSGFALGGGFFGLLDTGIRTSHTLLSGRYDYLGDCYGGTTDCSGGNPNDTCNHGTSTASVLSGNSSLGDANRGVTDYIKVDSWKVYKDSDCRPDTNAVVKAFQNAVASYDKFIVAELQLNAYSDAIAVSTAADAAFDSGSIVIAPAGNFGKQGAGSVTAPGSAHKVLAVGAVDIGQSRFMMDYSGQGPTSDGRFKPDFTAPTNVDAASGDSDTELRVFTGTSGATPFGAAAAALAYNFLRGAWWAIDPGQVYAYMILSGNNRNFDNDRGAGLLRMPVVEGTTPYGTLSYGMVTVTNYQSVDITMLCSSPGSVQAAIWWPETTTTPNDIDLFLLRPDGMIADASRTVTSVFEKVKTTSSPPSGEWTFRVHGYSVTGTQDVYFAALCL